MRIPTVQECLVNREKATTLLVNLACKCPDFDNTSHKASQKRFAIFRKADWIKGAISKSQGGTARDQYRNSVSYRKH